MITVPFENRIITIGVFYGNKDQLLYDMNYFIIDKPYNENKQNYRDFLVEQLRYAQYSVCMDYSTMTIAEGGQIEGNLIATGGLHEDELFKESFERYAINGRCGVWFLNSQQDVFSVAFNMEGKLLFTTDDLNKQFDARTPKRTLEIIKENQESSVFELDLDDIIL